MLSASGRIKSWPARVTKCEVFSGTAEVSDGTTLILTKRNLDNDEPEAVYVEFVHAWRDPAGLSAWSGRQWFDKAGGQRLEVSLVAVSLAKATQAYASGTAAANALAHQGKVLDTVVVLATGDDPQPGC